MKLKTKTMATLLMAILTISMMTFAAALPVDFPSEYGIWQPDDTSGIVECSDAQSNSGEYSAYLMVKAPGTYTPDSNEVYVLPYTDGNELVPQLLEDLDSFSFYYYRPSGLGEHSNIPPQVDIWLALGGIGTTENEWLLGQIDLATSTETWVEVPLSAITWIRAMGGTIYGTGSAGLEAAKTALGGTSEILGFGVQLGSPATRDDSRTEEGRYYIDDIEINGEVFDLEFTETTTLTTLVELPTISIDITETDLVYGTLIRGETSTTQVIHLVNVGDVNVDLSTTVIEDEAFYGPFLRLDGATVAAWEITNLAPANPQTINSVLQLPGTFASAGTYQGTLVFWAEETPPP